MVLLGRAGRRQRFGTQTTESSEVRQHLPAYAPAQQAMQSVETVSEANEAEAKVRMYDTIDGTWTGPLNQRAVETFHLRKVVYACSVCQWTSIWEGQFQEHVKTARMQYKMHSKAELLPSPTENGLAFRCTGCSSAFSMPGRVQLHIEGILRQTAGHEGAQSVMARRFALEAPVTPAKTQAVVAVASQLERTVVPQKRRGRHRRHRGGAHGN